MELKAIQISIYRREQTQLLRHVGKEKLCDDYVPKLRGHFDAEESRVKRI
jgi:hypothetical protein